MSLGYAERLSFREDLGGRLGDPEILERSQDVVQKIEVLAGLVGSAQKVVAFTGAGISTACGIPDFRGPNGVWTMQRQGKPLPKAKTSFLYAQPSLTHMALLGLMQAGKLTHICSQNVDSLHLRSGVPRSQLSELHGNCFAERCQKCKAEYVRDFEMDTVGFQPTGRSCTRPRCKGILLDHILDWEDPLPPAELKDTEQHASAADVSICLGTSLQIVPAANLPLRTVKAGGHLAIINLQATPKDKKAAVVIHAKVDQVMALLMQHLGVPIPAFVRTDRLVLSHKAVPGPAPAPGSSSSMHNSHAEQLMPEQMQEEQQHLQQQSGGGSPGGDSSAWSFTFTVCSVHGESCPLPMVTSAQVRFYDQAAFAATQVAEIYNGSVPAAAPMSAAPAMDSAAAAAAPVQQPPVHVEGLQEVLPGAVLSGDPPWRVQRGCPAELQQVAVVVTLQLAEAADQDKRQPQFHYRIARPQAPVVSPVQSGRRSTRGAVAKQLQQAQQPDGSETVSFVTQVREYAEEQQRLVAALLQDAGLPPGDAVTQQGLPAAAAAAGADDAGGGTGAALKSCEPAGPYLGDRPPHDRGGGDRAAVDAGSRGDDDAEDAAVRPSKRSKHCEVVA